MAIATRVTIMMSMMITMGLGSVSTVGKYAWMATTARKTRSCFFLQINILTIATIVNSCSVLIYNFFNAVKAIQNTQTKEFNSLKPIMSQSKSVRNTTKHQVDENNGK